MIPNEAEAVTGAGAPVDIFICYARSDYPYVQQLQRALEENGKSVWVDSPETVSSEEWQQASQPSIEAAQIILVVISPDFVNSPYNQQELDYALSLNKWLVPILYREGFEPDKVHPAIHELNWLFIRGFDDSGFALSQLLDRLNSGSDPSTSQPATEADTSETGNNTPLILEGHQGPVNSVAFSPDGKTLVSGSEDKTIRLWNLDGTPIGQPFQGHQSGIMSVSFSPDGRTIVSGSGDGTVRLWSLDGTPIGQPFQGHQAAVFSVAFSPDGKTIVSGSYDQTIRLWSLDGTPIGQPFQGHQGFINSVAFSLDGKTIASGSSDNTIRLWNLDGIPIGQPFQRHQNDVSSIAFSPDGKTIVSGSWDSTICLWRLDGTPIGQPFFHGYQGSVSSVAFSPDGRTLVSGSDDNMIRLWRLDGTPIGQPLQGHQDYVNSVAFSPDGKTLVSGSNDNTIRLWKIPYKIQITFVSQKLQNDLAKGRDCLNIEHEIYALADILAMRDVEPPLAVGILGGWGSGKSFAMHLIQQRLNEIRSRKLIWNQAWTDKTNPYVGHIYQIQFDAWTYAKADLWSSLMQTIFYEFNRQLTLEKQIAEALAQSKPVPEPVPEPAEKKNVWQSLKLRVMRQRSPEATPSSPSAKDLQQAQLEGGDFWQALNEMSESDRAIILQSKLTPEAFEQIKQSKSHQEFTDYLWKQIGSLRQGEKQALNQKSAILQKEKKDLRFLIVRRTPIYFLQKNWLVVATFLVGAGITAYPFLPKEVQNRLPPNLNSLLASFPSITVGSGLASAILTGKSLLDKTREEQEKVLAIWKKHQETLQTQTKSAREFGTAAYQDLLQHDPKIQQKLTDIQKLETQIGLQQQKLGLSSTTPSLNAFISDRLQTDSYTKQLGTLQQVQRDLADLTQHFTFPAQVDVAKEEFQEKLAKLQEIFPRGPARIVLYIDDLDRCPPDQVVKVLEAVQLILKTPLFIVVLAIDDRYVARALEKVYEGVLTRQGHPSGIDYLEKIIQLPYRMRPISPEGLEGYLKSQIDLEEILETPSQEQFDPNWVQQTTAQSLDPVQLTEQFLDNPQESDPQDYEADEQGAIVPQAQQSSSPEFLTPVSEPDGEDSPIKSVTTKTTETLSSSQTSAETFLTENISQITKFTQEEFRLIQDCCKHVDISPRTAKRLINIFKILKIVWSSTSEPDPEIKRTIISFLALSGRYPDFMRYAFNEIDTCFEKADFSEGDRTLVEILNPTHPPLSNTDQYAKREWMRFQHDIQQMISNTLTLNEMGRSTFNLILSFCFVGDIGYDPQDSSRTVDSDL